VQAAFYRSSFDKTIQLHGKYDAAQQRRSMPVSISTLVSIEGTDNFQEKYAPAPKSGSASLSTVSSSSSTMEAAGAASVGAGGDWAAAGVAATKRTITQNATSSER